MDHEMRGWGAADGGSSASDIYGRPGTNPYSITHAESAEPMAKTNVATDLADDGLLGQRCIFTIKQKCKQTNKLTN